MVSETTHPYQTPYDPPPYPYDLLDELRAVAQERFGAVIDCSIGAPIDPPPAAVIDALSSSNTERGIRPRSAHSRSERPPPDGWLVSPMSTSIR